VVAVTAIAVSLVDVYVLRGTSSAVECLVLRRAPGVVRPGSWETVHGRIDAGETPDRAALRELREETGMTPLRFYNLSRVESFYLHRSDEIALIPAFVALVAPDAEPTLSEEHDAAEWLPPETARARVTWPRERRALEDAVALFGAGDAGAVEDVLRVC
jgi:8-oxo-dGTP pyrophosphatase MutT (NUDIX family)